MKVKFRTILKSIIFGSIYDLKLMVQHFEFNKIKSEFDVSKNDENIANIADKIFHKYSNKFHKTSTLNQNSIGYLATILYNVGGHTACLINQIKSFHKEFESHLFLTMKRNILLDKDSKNIKIINNLVKIEDVNFLTKKANYVDSIISLYNKIIDSRIQILFLYIHMNDVVSVATISLLRKYTDIKIIFFNHADHLPVLGMKFSHLIIDARLAGQNITQEIRGYNNTILMPLQQQKIDETIYFPEIKIKEIRSQLGIKNDEYFTLTGGHSSKMFEENNSSEYFLMILNLLLAEPKLKHVIMSEFNDDLSIIIDKIFANYSDLKQRLIIIDRVPDFDVYMQACDLLIDTFPQGGALIHLDMMRNKKPTVVKINKKEPFKSFEFYLPKNYEYMYDNVEEMKVGILKLLYSKSEQKIAAEKLYQYYVDKYEFEIVKAKYRELIDNSDNLEQFFGRNFYEN